MAKRMEFIFGDIAMTFSPEDIEAVIAEWRSANPGKDLKKMKSSEFADACMKRMKAGARPARTVLHN